MLPIRPADDSLPRNHFPEFGFRWLAVVAAGLSVWLLAPPLWADEAQAPDAADSESGPYLVHVSDTAPGETMVLSGGGYDPATVEVLVHIPGTLTPQRDELPAIIEGLARQYGQGPPAPPDAPPQENTAALGPLRATAQTVFAELPRRMLHKNWPPGFLAVVWLKDGDRLSNPMIVNRPQAWFLLRPTSRPGELNRLCGANLVGDRYVPRYVFLRPAAGGAPRELELTPRHREDGFSEPFVVPFRVPDDLPPGKYEVFAHNNSGRAYGFTEPLPLQVTAEPRFRQELCVVTEHGVVGDSMTDNLAALQAIIDRVGSEGGGIVFLPPGAYRIDDTLQMRQGVILRGAGREATTLFYGGRPETKQPGGYWLINARDVHHTGFEDLTIRTASPKTMAISYYLGGEPIHDCHIRRCRIVGGRVSMQYGVGFELADCVFENAVFHATNLRSAWVHDNQFTLGRLRGNPVVLWATEHCTIEHNRVHRSTRGFVWQVHGEFGHYRNFIDTNETEATRFGGNAGETFLFEGAGFRWWGQPEDIGPSGFTVSGGGLEPDGLKNAFAIVTQGRGLGQYVRIAGNTAEEVTLHRPWPVVVPSGDVRITVMMGTVENAFTNNRDVHCDNSMMFFAAGMINNRIVRNRSENSLGISLWSRGRAAENELIPDYYNQFEANVLEDQGSFWMTRLGDDRQAAGIRNLNNVFRGNFVSDTRRKRENHYHEVWEHTGNNMYRPVQAAFWLDVGRSYQSDPTGGPIWIDTLIERNYITRCRWGVELRPISGGTVVYRNTFFDVATPILDLGSDTAAAENRFEQPADFLPPEAEMHPSPEAE